MGIIAVDFDNCLAETNYNTPDAVIPTIVKARPRVVAKVIELQQNNEIVLWTAREKQYLEEALSWCKEQGIRIDRVNENKEEEIKKWGTNPRKIYADVYIDDKALSVQSIEQESVSREKDKIDKQIEEAETKFIDALKGCEATKGKDSMKYEEYSKLMDEASEQLKVLKIKKNNVKSSIEEEK